MLKGPKRSWRSSVKKLLNHKTTLGTAWRLFRDKRMPRKNKLFFLGLAGAYLLLPTDIVADYLPLVGWVDDLAVWTLLLKGFIYSAPKELRTLHHPHELSQKGNRNKRDL